VDNYFTPSQSRYAKDTRDVYVRIIRLNNISVTTLQDLHAEHTKFKVRKDFETEEHKIQLETQKLKRVCLMTISYIDSFLEDVNAK
jgi:hypothetical protein